MKTADIFYDNALFEGAKLVLKKKSDYILWGTGGRRHRMAEEDTRIVTIQWRPHAA